MDGEKNEKNCLFCEFIRTQKPIVQNNTFFAKYDKYPVSKGHVLLIPKRHVETFFDLGKQEIDDFFCLLLNVRQIIQKNFQPDGFNIGINIGTAAGQTIMHLHIHLIPRYIGDIEHPEGGVRRVIPNLAKYPSQVE